MIKTFFNIFLLTIFWFPFSAIIAQELPDNQISDSLNIDKNIVDKSELALTETDSIATDSIIKKKGFRY